VGFHFVVSLWYLCGIRADTQVCPYEVSGHTLKVCPYEVSGQTLKVCPYEVSGQTLKVCPYAIFPSWEGLGVGFLFLNGKIGR